MRLLIVRHGETDLNIKRIMQGHVNSSLNEKGRAQAEKLGLRLKNEKIDVIISSDLDRALQTAMAIAQYQKAPIITTPEIRERNHGVFDGKSAEEYYKYLRDFGINRATFKPENGESYPMVRERAKKFLDKAFTKYKGKTVLLVSHGAFNRQLLGFLLGQSVEESIEMKQDNACLSIVECRDNGKHEVKLVSCVAHL